MSFRRVRRFKKQENLYKELTDKNEFGIFDTYKDVFMTSAVIGFMEEKKQSFSDTSEAMSWSVFNLDTDLTIINAVALCETKDPNILQNDEGNFDRKITIFEEYAAGGLQFLYEDIMKEKKYVAHNYFELIIDMQNQKPDKDRNIDDILGKLSF